MARSILFSFKRWGGGGYCKTIKYHMQPYYMYIHNCSCHIIETYMCVENTQLKNTCKQTQTFNQWSIHNFSFWGLDQIHTYIEAENHNVLHLLFRSNMQKPQTNHRHIPWPRPQYIIIHHLNCWFPSHHLVSQLLNIWNTRIDTSHWIIKRDMRLPCMY